MIDKQARDIPKAKHVVAKHLPDILVLWKEKKGPTPAWDAAVKELLDRVEQHASSRYRCRRRDAEYHKILAANLDTISRLVGFTSTDTWYKNPSCTLRFAEVLAKIYASKFSLGEIVFIFTADEHLTGDDPFPMPELSESQDDPLNLPEDDPDGLWKLRHELLCAEIGEKEAKAWNWYKISAAAREIGFAPTNRAGASAGPDPLAPFGEHFFPGLLEMMGHHVPPVAKQFQAELASSSTSPSMWGSSSCDPFHYVAGEVGHLWAQLPLRDQDVLSTLRHLRQLNAEEIQAVQDIYYAPRLLLAPLAPIFSHFDHAVDWLVQEPSEQKRFAYFQHEFALFHKRCCIIAKHLAEQVGKTTSDTHKTRESDIAVAWRILIGLSADENPASTTWEDDSGKPPASFLWGHGLSSSSYAALLGLLGIGALGKYEADGQEAWQELRSELSAFGVVRNEWNTPFPTIIPQLDLTPAMTGGDKVAATRNGFSLKDSDAQPLGGAEPFDVLWVGELLVDKHGEYTFGAGIPTPSMCKGEGSGCECAKHVQWLLTISRGQKRWTLLNHSWDEGDEAPDKSSLPVSLRRGVYHFEIHFKQLSQGKHRKLHTGFHVNYCGPDTCTRSVALPCDRVFQLIKQGPLGSELEIQGTAGKLLESRYYSTLRDIRRTYQRAFKAVLFAHRFSLSAKSLHGTAESELGFLLNYGAQFQGSSYYRVNDTTFKSHHAYFDFDFLPVTDVFLPPTPAVDARSSPSPQRSAALFDWWERIFDYCHLRAEVRCERKEPVWSLFREAIDQQAPSQMSSNSSNLVRHLDVETGLASLVLNYFTPSGPSTLVNGDLEDEKWAIRVWKARGWICRVQKSFFSSKLVDVIPWLWAADDPNVTLGSATVSGNQNLTHFFDESCFLEAKTKRFEDVKELNDQLRERGRAALLLYCCGMSRVKLDAFAAAGKFAEQPSDLSALLLQDVAVGHSQVFTRIDAAIQTVQTFVQRARLGLEMSFATPPAFTKLWDHQFIDFETWRRNQRMQIYNENWVKWDEMQESDKSEGFRFLEARLLRDSTTIPDPAAHGGHLWWLQSEQLPPQRPIDAVQARDFAKLDILTNPAEGLPLKGRPDKSARPSWLAPVPSSARIIRPPTNGEGPPSIPPGGTPSVPPGGTPSIPPGGTPSIPPENGPKLVASGRSDRAAVIVASTLAPSELPLWIQAPVKLGTEFLRIAAAGEPIGVHLPHLKEDDVGTALTRRLDHDGGSMDEPVVDEYYFWLSNSQDFNVNGLNTNADVGSNPTTDPSDPTSDWERDEKVAQLLVWDSTPMVSLHWSRVHLDTFDGERRSSEGLPVVPKIGTGPPTSADLPKLAFTGRTADSLFFTVTNIDITAFKGYLDTTVPGFRYDLATDSAVPLPQVRVQNVSKSKFGDLVSFPRFVYFEPGAPLVPISRFSTALSIAGALRMHCKFEAALKWCDLVFSTLQRENTWAQCRKAVPSGEGVVAKPSEGLPAKRTEDPVTKQTEGPVVEPDRTTRDQACCPTSPVKQGIAQPRAVMLEYVEILLQWGQSLLSRNSSEALQQALVLFDVADRILGPTPKRVKAKDLTQQSNQQTISNFVPNAAPLNPRLLKLYDETADYRAHVHDSFNESRQLNGKYRRDLTIWDSRYADAHHRMRSCQDQASFLAACHPYRYIYLLPKAMEIVAMLRGLGSALLSAFEKGDGEYLNSLRLSHERKLLDLALETKKNAWRGSEWALQALQQTMQGAQSRLRYTQNLITNGVNGGETGYQIATEVSNGVRAGGNILDATAQATTITPDL